MGRTQDLNAVDPGDLIDPADIDWREADDGTVLAASKAGIPQAVEEAARRNGRAVDIHKAVTEHRARRRGR